MAVALTKKSGIRRTGEMDEHTLKAILKREIAGSIGGSYGNSLTSEHSQALIEQREQALKAYYGEPIGNEVEGRSQAVMTDVADTLEWFMPSLLEFLTAPQRICKFKPVRAVHADVMDHAAMYVHHMLFKENPGYKLLYDFIFDGLLLKTGIMKVTADDEPKQVKTVKRGLTDDELAWLEEQEGIEVTSDEVDKDTGMRTTEMLVEVQKGRIEVQCIRPEAFAVSNDAESLDDSSVLFQVQEETRSDLVKMGFDEDTIYRLPKWEGRGFQQVTRERNQVDSSGLSDNIATLDQTQEEVLVFEMYLPVDFDGDGFAEYRKITAAGDALEILDNDEVDTHPFVTWCPFPMPHKFYGLSLADRLYDVQVINSTLVRQELDAAYNANINRTVVDITAIDPDDVLVNNQSGVIKMDAREHSKSVRDVIETLPNVPVNVMPMIEWMQGVKAMRSGIDPDDQDSTPQALANSMSGVALNIRQSSKRKKQEMVARHVAEAVGRACTKILQLGIQHGITIEVQDDDGNFVPLDPSEWSMDMVASVEVGLGYGSRDREIAAAGDLIEMQGRFVEMQGGLDGPLISPEKIVAAAGRFVQASQLGTATEFVGPTEQPEIPPQILQQIQQEAAQEVMQSAEYKKLEGELAKIQADMTKTQAETEAKVREMMQRESLAMMQLELERAKLRLAELQPQLEAERNRINLEREIRSADVDEQKAEFEAGLAAQQAEDDQDKAILDYEVDQRKLDQERLDSDRDYAIEREKLAIERKKAEQPAPSPTGKKEKS